MSNKQDWMYERLDRLVKLCKSTEPDNPDDTWLFTPQVIEAHDMCRNVLENYEIMDNFEKVDIMTKANKIWKIRRKIWNGEWDDVSASTLHTEVEDLIKAGAIIEAIKHYRNEMKTHLSTDVSLKESKDYVDVLRADLNRRGFKN
tara:strand:- start:1 stop:435 length:435 start_codon:yes stop_codon:yes gene_type:complete